MSSVGEISSEKTSIPLSSLETPSPSIQYSSSIIKHSSSTVHAYLTTFIIGFTAGSSAEILLYPLEGSLARHVSSVTTSPSQSLSQILYRYVPYKINFMGIWHDLMIIIPQKAPVTGLILASYELFKKSFIQLMSADTGNNTTDRVSWLSFPTSSMFLSFYAALGACFLEGIIWTPFANAQSLRQLHMQNEAASLNQLNPQTTHSTSAANLSQVPTSSLSSTATPLANPSAAAPQRAPFLAQLSKPSLLNVIYSSFKSSGIGFVYKGFWSVYVTTAPFLCCFFVFDDVLARYFSQKWILKHSTATNNNHNNQSVQASSAPPLWYMAQVGAWAAILATLVATPFEFIRIRIYSEFKHRQFYYQMIQQFGFKNTVKSIIFHQNLSDLPSHVNSNPSNIPNISQQISDVHNRCSTDIKKKLFFQPSRFALRRAIGGSLRRTSVKLTENMSSNFIHGMTGSVVERGLPRLLSRVLQSNMKTILTTMIRGIIKK